MQVVPEIQGELDKAEVELGRVQPVVPVAVAAPAQKGMTRASTAQLAQFDNLIVKQTRRGCMQELMGCEAKNEFLISAQPNPNQVLMYSLEESSCFMRTCCKNNRAMKQTVWVGQNESAMDLPNNLPVVMGKKGLTCGAQPQQCCFNPYLDLFSGQDEPMGKVTVPFFWCVPSYKVFNEENVQEYDIHMPICFGCCVNCFAQGCCNCKIPFYIYRPDQTDRGKGQEIGNIIKQWRGFGTEMFTDADTFTIDFPKDANSDQKARLLGMTFLLNMMEFEKPQKNN